MEQFWKVKPLAEFSEEEWEAVCMKCGKCCLFKFQEAGEIHFSNRMCGYFDFRTGRCSCYASRLKTEDCAKVDMHLLQTEPELLPETCAYRLLLEGKDLPPHHPLVCGDANAPHKAKATVLEMEGVYSIDELKSSLMELNRRFVDEQLSPERFDEEEDKVFRQYAFRSLEHYAIPQKPATDE